jgi:hypothetical protein
VRARLLLVGVVLASIAPFLGRAVFIDEHIYLRLAQSALDRPLFPADTPLLFFGEEYANHAGHTHPPAGEYYLAGLFILLGEFNETTFRLLFAVFPAGAILAFYELARRFCREPLHVSLLLAVSPSFLVLAPTLMMDMPMLAFLLAGLAFYFAGRLILAAACFTLAVGTGYTALVPIGCLAFILWISGRPLRELLPVAAAPVVLATWLAVMTMHFGEFPLKQTADYLFFRDLATLGMPQILKNRTWATIMNAVAMLSFLGGLAMFPGSIRLRRTRSWVAAGVLALLLGVLIPSPSLLHRFWFVILAACGIMLLAAFAGAASALMRTRERDGGEAVLILWVPAVLAFFILAAEMINARYVLLALPPLFLIVLRESSRSALIGIAVPTALLSLALAVADARFVNSYRTWVNSVAIPVGRDGFALHSATESGLRFYLETAGAKTLSRHDRTPAGSDLLIRADMFRYSLAEDVEVVSTALQRFVLYDRYPIRTFNPAAGAGFHDSRFGLVPYMASRKPYDVIEVAQINPLVRSLPQPSADPTEYPVWGPHGPVFIQEGNERFFPMRFPNNMQIQYELDGGEGFIEQTSEGLRLVKTSGGALVWRRLRFVPSKLMEIRN